MTSSAAPSPIDSEKLEELRDLFDEPGELASLFQDFFDELPERLKAIRTGIQTSEFEMVGRAAHTLKGSSANLGAFNVQQTAAGLEMICQTRDLQNAGSLMEKLETELELLRLWLGGEDLI